MRIFVSSTFEDLREHRAAAIRVLRQLGHEVVAMEDFVAGGAVPLKRVLDDVKRCDTYVGIFAWRYGFLPKVGKGAPALPLPPGAEPNSTSITHCEYLQAKASNLEILAFLLDESCAWPPHLIDGFATSDPAAPRDNSAIRALRGAFQLERVVSYFTSPADLEARVSAAVTVAGMSKQVRLNLVQLGPPISTVSDSDPFMGIRDSIVGAGRHRVLQIELDTTWWSTRLYLTAWLANRLTEVRRLVVLQAGEFIGLVATSTIVATLAPLHPKLRKIHARLRTMPAAATDIHSQMEAVFKLWQQVVGDPRQEESVKVDVTSDLLRRWMGDAMLQQPVRITDLAQASVVDLLRLLDYPNDFVPVVIQRGDLPPTMATESVKVVDKTALNAQLAQSYVIELMDRARIT
ncbi:MAG TPA: DUF4062 domain-containing protein [Geminicoccaceae bacterium]|nr:DUF4062 domain-containing protein [Geminicoccaceae bacterium]